MDDDEWYFSLKDGRVVRAGEGVRAADRLGPYPDRETAARALEIARERTETRDREDREWNRGTPPAPDPDRA